MKQEAPPADAIVIRGARQNNLKNLTLQIPRDKLVLVTGLSGSGKSSLAFDTIFAEGQRRYVESLSAYARQFDQLFRVSAGNGSGGVGRAVEPGKFGLQLLEPGRPMGRRSPCGR